MRLMNKLELDFLANMLKSSSFFQIDLKNLPCLQVEDANDGGMGGLVFLSKNKDRHLGEDISQCEFDDQDGVKVIVTLSVDNFGDLYELDVWKTDFSKLISFPVVSSDI